MTRSAQDIFRCSQCGFTVANRGTVYAEIQRRYDYSDQELDAPAMNIQVWHVLCATIDETIYTLPDQHIEQIVEELLNRPSGFVFAFNPPLPRKSKVEAQPIGAQSWSKS